MKRSEAICKNMSWIGFLNVRFNGKRYQNSQIKNVGKPNKKKRNQRAVCRKCIKLELTGGRWSFLPF